MYDVPEAEHEVSTAGSIGVIGNTPFLTFGPTLPGDIRTVRTGDIVPYLVGATVNEVEQELVLQTLAHCDGNRTHAARILGVSVRTLRNKIRLYTDEGIAVPAHA